MKEKKHIDELFKNRFEHFEASPSPKVWENIQTQLSEKKEDRKVVPLWIKLGGIAALLALLFTVGNGVFTSDNANNPTITSEDSIELQKTENIEKDSEVDKINSENSNAIVLEENGKNNAEESNLNSEDRKLNTETNTSISNSAQKEDSKLNSSTNTSISNSTKKGDSKLNSEKDKLKANSNDNSKIASKDIQNKSLNNTKKDVYNNSEKIKQTNPENKSSEGIAASTQKNKNSKELNKSIVPDKVISGDKQNVVALEESLKDKISEKGEVSENKVEEAVAVENANKKSILDAISEDKEDPLKVKNPKPENRWNVMPNIAPVYYSSFGKGSSIDPNFSDNSQSGDVNISYGVQVSYAINNKLSVRTGINNVDLSYATSDVILATGAKMDGLASVNYAGRGVVVTAIDKGAFNQDMSSSEFQNLNLKSTQGDAKIIQNLNYYEVPVELKYALIDTKIGVNVIGGVSTLFLGNNEISVKSNDFNSVLGEANNLSSVSFTTNLGLGLDYKLSKQFTFNIEPMFKYQLNPYTDSSVNFKPYYLGVYSGFSFRF